MRPYGWAGDDVAFPAIEWLRSGAHGRAGVKNASHACVLWCLATYASESGECYPSVRALARDTCLHPDTVRRAIRALCEMGLMERKVRVRKDGGHTSNTYRLRLEAFVDDDLNASPPMTDDHTGVGPSVIGGVGSDVIPMKTIEKTTIEETESAGEGLDIRALEQAVLDCLPPRKRGMMLDRASAGILAAMAEKHGVEACLAAAGECGGADRPAYMLRARLEHPTRGKGGRSRLPDAARISENWGATEEQKLPWRTTLPGAHAGPSDDPELDRLFGIETKDGMK